MHEVELATRVLKTLHQISAGRGARVLEVNLRVGEINEPRSLGLWLKKLGGDEFNSTGFNIVRVPIMINGKYGYSGEAKSLDTHLPEPGLGIACPKCGRHGASLTSGTELEIVNVKLEKGVKKRRMRKSR